jgi:hypothetical protein
MFALRSGIAFRKRAANYTSSPPVLYLCSLPPALGPREQLNAPMETFRLSPLTLLTYPTRRTSAAPKSAPGRSPLTGSRARFLLHTGLGESPSGWITARLATHSLLLPSWHVHAQNLRPLPAQAPKDRHGNTPGRMNGARKLIRHSQRLGLPSSEILSRL